MAACLLSEATKLPLRLAIMSLTLLLLVCSHLLISANAFSTTTAESSSKLIRLLPDGSANDILYQLLQEQQQQQQQETITNGKDNEPKAQKTHNSSPTLIQLTGIISKRRAIGKHLIFLDVIPVNKIPTLQQHQKKGVHFDSLSEIAPVQAIMRRDFWNDIQKQRSDDNISNNATATTSTFDVYHKIIQPGTYCTIHGHVGPSRNQKEAILFCTSLKYKLANNNPQHLRNVLKFVADGVLDSTEVLEALPTLTHPDELIPSTTKAAVVNQTYGELATHILDTFPPKFLLNPSQLMGSTDAAKVQLLPPVPHEFCTFSPFIFTDVKEKVTGSESLTISQALQQQKQQHDNCLISITGWVQNRRRYQGSVSVLEVVDTFSSSFRTMNGDEDDDSNNNSNDNDGVNSKKLKEMWKERIYAVIHPDALCCQETAEMYGNLLSAGARFMMEGFMTKFDDNLSDDANAASFWVTRIRLLRSSFRQGEIRQLLDLVHEGKFLDIEEAAGALNIPYSQAEELAEGTATPAERQWLAAEMTMKLQGENSRVGKISNEMMESLSTYAYARDRYPIQEESSRLGSRLAAGANNIQNAASSILESNQGGNPRRTSLDGSRWQHKKRPQLEVRISLIY
jgi:hypothetical protein